MKKLTKQELAGMEFKSRNGRSSHKVIKAVKSLKVGEAIHLEPKDWKMRSQPSQYISTLLLNQVGIRVKVRSLADKKGWVIVRQK